MAKRTRPPSRRSSTSAARRAAPSRRRRRAARPAAVAAAELKRLDALRRAIERSADPPRWNASPEDVERSVARLVLTLVEFLRRVLERQAIRRMEAGTLSDDQIEDLGRALMQLEAAIRKMASKFGLSLDDLDMDLGPLGRLM